MSRHSSIPLDTTDDAHEAQNEVCRRLGGPQRLAIQFRLSAMTRQVAMAGIRARHPSYDESQARQALARLLFVDAVVRTAWPDRDLVDP